jgi:hypothetical protein
MMGPSPLSSEGMTPPARLSHSGAPGVQGSTGHGVTPPSDTQLHLVTSQTGNLLAGHAISQMGRPTHNSFQPTLTTAAPVPGAGPGAGPGSAPGVALMAVPVPGAQGEVSGAPSVTTAPPQRPPAATHVTTTAAPGGQQGAHPWLGGDGGELPGDKRRRVTTDAEAELLGGAGSGGQASPSEDKPGHKKRQSGCRKRKEPEGGAGDPASMLQAFNALRSQLQSHPAASSMMPMMAALGAQLSQLAQQSDQKQEPLVKVEPGAAAGAHMPAPSPALTAATDPNTAPTASVNVAMAGGEAGTTAGQQFVGATGVPGLLPGQIMMNMGPGMLGGQQQAPALAGGALGGDPSGMGQMSALSPAQQLAILQQLLDPQAGGKQEAGVLTSPFASAAQSKGGTPVNKRARAAAKGVADEESSAGDSEDDMRGEEEEAAVQLQALRGLMPRGQRHTRHDQDQDQDGSDAEDTQQGQGGRASRRSRRQAQQQGQSTGRRAAGTRHNARGTPGRRSTRRGADDGDEYEYEDDIGEEEETEEAWGRPRGGRGANPRRGDNLPGRMSADGIHAGRMSLTGLASPATGSSEDVAAAWGPVWVGGQPGLGGGLQVGPMGLTALPLGGGAAGGGLLLGQGGGGAEDQTWLQGAGSPGFGMRGDGGGLGLAAAQQMGGMPLGVVGPFGQQGLLAAGGGQVPNGMALIGVQGQPGDQALQMLPGGMVGTGAGGLAAMPTWATQQHLRGGAAAGGGVGGSNGGGGGYRSGQSHKTPSALQRTELAGKQRGSGQRRGDQQQRRDLQEAVREACRKAKLCPVSRHYEFLQSSTRFAKVFRMGDDAGEVLYAVWPTFMVLAFIPSC